MAIQDYTYSSPEPSFRFMLFPLTEIFCSLFVQLKSTSVYTQNKKQSEDAANMTMSNAEGRIELINCPKWLISIRWVYKSNINGKPSEKRKLHARIELQTNQNVVQDILDQ
jgi:hypothetical protein